MGHSQPIRSGSYTNRERHVTLRRSSLHRSVDREIIDAKVDFWKIKMIKTVDLVVKANLPYIIQ